MEPIEINAGPFYLRGLRADRLIDDRPALAGAFADEGVRRAVGAHDPDAYLATRARQWAEDTGCSWAVAEPTTGRLLGEVGLLIESDSAVAYCWTLPKERRKGVASTALGAVLRFGTGALELVTIRFRLVTGDDAAARLAAACGLTCDDQVLVTASEAEMTEWHFGGT